MTPSKMILTAATFLAVSVALVFSGCSRGQSSQGGTATEVTSTQPTGGWGEVMLRNVTMEAYPASLQLGKVTIEEVRAHGMQVFPSRAPLVLRKQDRRIPLQIAFVPTFEAGHIDVAFCPPMNLDSEYASRLQDKFFAPLTLEAENKLYVNRLNFIRPGDRRVIRTELPIECAVPNGTGRLGVEFRIYRRQQQVASFRFSVPIRVVASPHDIDASFAIFTTVGELCGPGLIRGRTGQLDIRIENYGAYDDEIDFSVDVPGFKTAERICVPKNDVFLKSYPVPTGGNVPLGRNTGRFIVKTKGGIEKNIAQVVEVRP